MSDMLGGGGANLPQMNAWRCAQGRRHMHMESVRNSGSISTNEGICPLPGLDPGEAHADVDLGYGSNDELYR